MKKYTVSQSTVSPEMIMEAFVETADKMAEAQGFTKAEFARAVWPESSPRVASYRWQSMRNKVRNTGKPQGVLISDAFRIARSLEQPLAYIFLLAENLADEKQAKMEAEGQAAAPVKGRKNNPARK